MQNKRENVLKCGVHYLLQAVESMLDTHLKKAEYEREGELEQKVQ